jgi:N-acetylated-alpha-linked acidic dipeptidase
VPGDASSEQVSAELPAYVAYQGDGDVTAGLVYVNYGMPDDYKTLERLGIDVKGKIVIARYGSGWRGLKPKLAQDHGAVGCIIYSDPAEDGYSQDKTYPDGPMRPPQGIQRGSVVDMTLYPGDPLTPGIGATHDAKRLKISEAQVILKIPVLPISYADAEPLLKALDGAVAPKAWRGGLAITYHVGPGPATLHLAVKSDWGMKTVYDVIATIKGSIYPDQWVVRGNHHDGWVFGASDPLSGQSALMKQGWKPKRTMVYASWDGEEPGLIGSTEWAETHADELKRKAVLYINTDNNGRGILSAGGSHDFQHLVNQVADDVIDPEAHVPIGARLRSKLRVDAAAPGASPEAIAKAKIAADPAKDFPIDALGSGSDYSTFLEHLGVPALNISFEGEGQSGGVYHSAYDTFEHHSRFVDPGFVYDALLARTVGRLVLRVADAPLPLQRAGDQAATVAAYLDQIKELAAHKREAAETQSAMLRDRAFQLSADPTESSAPPAALERVPYTDFAPLENAVDRLKRSAKDYDEAFARNAAGLPSDRAAKLQALMQTIDQTLTSDTGLPGRPWYRNLVYAPGRLTGYGTKTLPGVREAIEAGRWAEAANYLARTAAAVDAAARRIDAASALLGAAKG